MLQHCLPLGDDLSPLAEWYREDDRTTTCAWCDNTIKQSEMIVDDRGVHFCSDHCQRAEYLHDTEVEHA